jgi:hypothetical protein
MINEIDKGITFEDLDGVDDVVEASNIEEKKVPNSSPVEEDDNGVLDLSSMDFEDAGTYKPSLESADRSKINKIIADNMSYIASRDDSVFAKQKKAILKEIEDYKKDLIINKGFTEEEAAAAAEKRAEKLSNEATIDYKTNNPEVAIIKVNKTDADKLEIAPEDKAKVRKASAIRLIEVEDADLKHIKIKKGDSKSPIRISKLNTCALTRYTVPCVNTVDMCTFAGTSTYNLMNLYFTPDDTYRTRLIKQMDLAYEKFVSSTTKEKYTTAGTVAMSKEDFLNWFAFADLTAAIYAIYVASSTETITSQFECTNETCLDPANEKGEINRHKFNYSYKCTDIMKFDTIDDNFKPVYEGILANNDNFEEMTSLRDKYNVGHRYKSTITNNIYDIEAPSCARALEFAKFVEDNDDDNNQLSEIYFAIAIHIAKIYLYCGEEDGEPVYAEVTDPDEIYAIVSDAIEPEFNLYTKKLIPNKTYNYNTSLTYKCDKCGNEVTQPVDVATLVFLKAQGMGSEIE